MSVWQTRRDFATTISAIGAAALLPSDDALAEEEPPETTTIRLARDPTICVAPGQIVEALLRAEGFTDVRYQRVPHSGDAVVRSEIDFTYETAAWVVSHLAQSQPITALTGLHSGCYELFAHPPIRTITDLRGRRVGIPQAPGSSGHLLLATIAAHVGLNPRSDIDWVTTPAGDFLDAFAERKVDAFLGFPPEPQQLRARGIGHVILNIGTDKPWSQYFCCFAFGNREFVRANPIATRRYLRALLKATDICAAEPSRAARTLVEAGFTGRYDYALQALTEVRYDRWRDFDPEDTLRFYALRLRDVGMIDANPKELIAGGVDWRFLKELKRELKA
jgi:NitT/TauT family transport system substrate-binding protein